MGGSECVGEGTVLIGKNWTTKIWLSIHVPTGLIQDGSKMGEGRGASTGQGPGRSTGTLPGSTLELRTTKEKMLSQIPMWF